MRELHSLERKVEYHGRLRDYGNSFYGKGPPLGR
jgi:hypothetical protein